MKIWMARTNVAEEHETADSVRWSGSEAQAKKDQKALAEERSLKYSQTSREAVDVGSGKAGLIEFLNEHATTK